MNRNLILILESFRNRDVTLLLNRGNRGDGVIHMGGRQLFSQLGLHWNEIHEDDENLADAKGDVLLVFGCGGLARSYQSLAQQAQRIAGNFKQIVLLPASFDLRSAPVLAYARSWDHRYTIFCREMVSYDALSKESGVRPKQILLGHDLAFHADLSSWANRSHKGVIGIIRRDKEATNDAFPTDIPIDDASNGSETEPAGLLDCVAAHSIIYTDRCHAAITGAMMGRRVFFYRNNYFKNRAIYEHSLANFPNVSFTSASGSSLKRMALTWYWQTVRPWEMRARRVLGGRRRPVTV